MSHAYSPRKLQQEDPELSCFPTTHTQKNKKYPKQSLPVLTLTCGGSGKACYVLYNTTREYLHTEREGVPTNHTKV